MVEGSPTDKSSAKNVDVAGPKPNRITPTSKIRPIISGMWIVVDKIMTDLDLFTIANNMLSCSLKR